MIRRASLAICVVMVCGYVIALEGQSQAPNNQTPAQAEERRSPPSQQAQPSPSYEVFYTAADQPPGKKEQSYGRQFVDHLLTDPIVWLTIALAWLAWVQLKVYRAEVKDTRAVERGYLSVAQNSVEWHRGDEIHVRIEIKNVGNTPLAVHTGFFRLIENIENVGVITLEPTDHRTPGGYLVRDQHYFVELDLQPSESQYVAMRTGRLYLMGWVDYVDKFDEIHRTGYARRITIRPDNRIELLWDDPSARLNYDTPIDRQGGHRKE